METVQVRELIRREIPVVLRENEELQQFVRQLFKSDYADRGQTESRFDRVLEELRRDREEQARKWDEQNRKWDENQAVINQLLEEVHALAHKHDSSIGALGARWGLQTEESFRSALKGILEDFAGVEVLNLVEYDEEGEVFDHPCEIELDVVIRDGTLILCEIKSSMNRSDITVFERKVKFYEKRHNRRVDKKIAISPMVDDTARELAKKWGIQVYSYVENIDPATFK